MQRSRLRMNLYDFDVFDFFAFDSIIRPETTRLLRWCPSQGMSSCVRACVRARVTTKANEAACA